MALNISMRNYQIIHKYKMNRERAWRGGGGGGEYVYLCIFYNGNNDEAIAFVFDS